MRLYFYLIWSLSKAVSKKTASRVFLLQQFSVSVCFCTKLCQNAYKYVLNLLRSLRVELGNNLS